MKKTTLLAIILCCSIFAIGQDIQVTFSGTGASNVVDSVTATNLTTLQSIKLPGNETLILEPISGIFGQELSPLQLKLFPNPFENTSSLSFTQPIPGKVHINARNLIGQVVFQSDQYLEAGQHSFNLSLNTQGIFIITITSENVKCSIKAICTESNSNLMGIVSSDNATNGMGLKSHFEQKNQNSVYSLPYSPEQRIHFTCKGGRFTTIITDSPISSKNYVVEFVECMDSDNKTYMTVKIGDQIWMAENMAKSASEGSWAYNNDEGLVPVFGRLYDWQAASTICPAGWHLPSDEEYKILESDQGMTPDDLDKIGFRYSGDVGFKLKSFTGYVFEGSGNNSSGFNAPPGGYRDPITGNSYGINTYCLFWTSTETSHEAYGMYRQVEFIGMGVKRDGNSKSYGISVRCVKD